MYPPYFGHLVRENVILVQLRSANTENGLLLLLSLSLYYCFRSLLLLRLYLRDLSALWKVYTKWGRRAGRSHARNVVWALMLLLPRKGWDFWIFFVCRGVGVPIEYAYHVPWIWVNLIVLFESGHFSDFENSPPPWSWGGGAEKNRGAGGPREYMK